MEFKVVWSESAIADLKNVAAHIAQNNPSAAERMGNGIIDHVQIRASFPFIGPAYPRGSEGRLREIVFRSFRIFYDVSEESLSVEVLHVRHGSRQVPDFFPE